MRYTGNIRTRTGYPALLFCCFILLSVLLPGCGGTAEETETTRLEVGDKVVLPEPRYDSDVSLEESLLARRSVRSYSSEPLTLDEISQLLWAAQGITDDAGHRTAPSAVAIYPLKIYIAVGNVQGLQDGIYIYFPEDHSLSLTALGDRREELSDAAMGQPSIRQGAAAFIITANYDIVMSRFNERGEMFTHLEAGHAAQNLCLQAAALDLGVVTAGLIDYKKVAAVLDLPSTLHPVYVIPAGKKE